MSFAFFFQLLINGIIAGSIYSLISSGFSLIYTTNRFINFSHGSVVVLAAFAAYFFFNILRLPFIIAGLFAIAFIIFFGLMNFRLVYNPLRKRGASNASLLVASIGCLILIESLLIMLFGAGVKSYFLFDTSQGINLLGAVITKIEIIIVLSSVLVLTLLYLFLHKCRTGKKMQAVSDEPALAETVGISSRKIRSLAIIIASVIAGLAGILIGLEYSFEPMMGTNLMIKGFTGAIVGGASSILGSVLGAFIVGILENIGIGFLPSGFKDAITFTLLFTFLLIKPRGLFGKWRDSNA